MLHVCIVQLAAVNLQPVIVQAQAGFPEKRLYKYMQCSAGFLSSRLHAAYSGMVMVPLAV